MSTYLLLTGAAGQVGQYLLRDLLAQGIPAALLMRGRNGTTPEARIERMLAQFEAELGRALPRPICLQGDIAQPRLGMSHEAWHWATRHCSRVLHNAACVTFQGSDRRLEPWLSNVTGTCNVLEFCRQSAVREFHYMSTAYVCGRRCGTIFEDDPLAAVPFRNDYEHSKFEAEQIVRAADFLERPTIYRPATIVGDSHSGQTTSYHGLYHYLRFVSVVRHSARLDEDGRFHAAIRFNLTGDERRNLVPIDWVSAVSTHILLNPRWHGQTYHLTPLQSVSVREIDDAASSYFGYHGSVFVGPGGLAGAELNELENRFYGLMTQYEPYWSEEPTFDCSNTVAAAGHLPCPALNKQLLIRLIDFAVRDRWGKRRPGR